MFSICFAEFDGICRTEWVTLGYLKMAKQLKEIRDCILPPAFGKRKEYLLFFVAHPKILKDYNNQKNWEFVLSAE